MGKDLYTPAQEALIKSLTEKYVPAEHRERFLEEVFVLADFVAQEDRSHYLLYSADAKAVRAELTNLQKRLAAFRLKLMKPDHLYGNLTEDIFIGYRNRDEGDPATPREFEAYLKNPVKEFSKAITSIVTLLHKLESDISRPIRRVNKNAKTPIPAGRYLMHENSAIIPRMGEIIYLWSEVAGVTKTYTHKVKKEDHLFTATGPLLEMITAIFEPIVGYRFKGHALTHSLKLALKDTFGA